MDGSIGTRRWKTVRRMAYQRDAARGAGCHLCHGEPWGLGPIDYDAPASSPTAYEPDHVVPRGDRPDLKYDLANIAPAHSKCNRERRNASVEAYKARKRAEWARTHGGDRQGPTGRESASHGVGRTTRAW